MQISAHQINSMLVVLVAFIVIYTTPVCKGHLLGDLPYWRTFQPDDGTPEDIPGPSYLKEPLTTSVEEPMMMYPVESMFESGPLYEPMGEMILDNEDQMPAKRTWRTIINGEREGYYKRSQGFQLPKRTWRTVMRGETGSYYKRSLPNNFDNFQQYFY